MWLQLCASVQARGALAYEQLRGEPLATWDEMDATRQHLVIPCAQTLKANQRPAPVMDMEVSWDIILSMRNALSKKLSEVFHVRTEFGWVVYLQASADGRMLNEDLQADQASDDYVGLARDTTWVPPNGIAHSFFQMSAEQRADIAAKVTSNLANNVDTYVAQDLSGTIWCPIAIFLVGSGGGHKKVLERLDVVRRAVSVCTPRLEEYVERLRRAMESGDKKRWKEVLSNPPSGEVEYCRECSVTGQLCDQCKTKGYTSPNPDHRKCTVCMNSGGQCGPRFRLRYLEQDQLKENQTAGSKLREHTIGEVSPLYGMMHWIKKVRNWLKWWDIFDAELASWMGLTMLQSAWIHMAAMQTLLDWPDVACRHLLKDKHAVAIFRGSVEGELQQLQNDEGGIATVKVPNTLNGFKARNHASFGRPTCLVWLTPEGGGFVADGEHHVVWGFKQSSVWEIDVVLGVIGDSATGQQLHAHTQPQHYNEVRLKCPQGMCRMGPHLLICDHGSSLLRCFHFVCGTGAAPEEQQVTSLKLGGDQPEKVQVLDAEQALIVVSSVSSVRALQLSQTKKYHTKATVKWECKILDDPLLSQPPVALYATAKSPRKWTVYVLLSDGRNHEGPKLVRVGLCRKGKPNKLAVEVDIPMHLLEQGENEFGTPTDMCMLGGGTLLFTDMKHNVVKAVDLLAVPAGSKSAISVFAGNGGRDKVAGGPKLSVCGLSQPSCIATMGNSVLVGLASGALQGSLVQVDELTALCRYLHNGRKALESNGVLDKWHPEPNFRRELKDRLHRATLQTLTKGLDETVQYLESLIRSRRESLGMDANSGTDGRCYCIPSHTVAGYRDAINSLYELVDYCHSENLAVEELKIQAKTLLSERELEGLYGCLTLMNGTGNHAFTAADFRRMVRTMVHEQLKQCCDTGHAVVWGAARGANKETYSLSEGKRDLGLPHPAMTGMLLMGKSARIGKRRMNRQVLNQGGIQKVKQYMANMLNNFKQRCKFVRAVCTRENKHMANARYIRKQGEKKLPPQGAPDGKLDGRIGYGMLKTTMGRNGNLIPVSAAQKPALDPGDVVPACRATEDSADYGEYDYYLRMIAERLECDEDTDPENTVFKFWWLQLVPIELVEEALDGGTTVWTQWCWPNGERRSWEQAALSEIPSVLVVDRAGRHHHELDVLALQAKTVTALKPGGQSQNIEAWLLSADVDLRLKREYPVGGTIPRASTPQHECDKGESGDEQMSDSSAETGCDNRDSD